METLRFFFSQGWQHIADITAYDHILFVIALTSVYALRQWRTIVWLITAFTVGHSLALAMAMYDVFRLPVAFVEWLIPVTILLTCAVNITNATATEAQAKSHITPKANWAFSKYILAVVFGLVHGMGFSNYLRHILAKEDSLFMPLVGFNIGLEAGQLLIVAAALLLNWLIVEKMRASLRDWIFVVSAAVAGIALVLSIETGYAFFVGESAG
jgi:hypothetical protein